MVGVNLKQVALRHNVSFIEQKENFNEFFLK